MAGFVSGDIVVLPFPFSDASNTKNRPVVVLKVIEFEGYNGAILRDCLVCMVTTRNVKDPHAISLEQNDLDSGSLRLPSSARPTYLFTADERVISRRIGKLKDAKLVRILQEITSLFASE